MSTTERRTATDGVQRLRPYTREAQQTYVEGKSPAAWAGSMIALFGFCLLTYFGLWGYAHFGKAGVIASVAVILLGGLVTMLMKAQGYGTPARDL